MPLPLSDKLPPDLKAAFQKHGHTAASYSRSKGMSDGWVSGLFAGPSRLARYERFAHKVGLDLDTLVQMIEEETLELYLKNIVQSGKVPSIFTLAMRVGVSPKWVKSLFSKDKLNAIHSYRMIATDYKLPLSSLVLEDNGFESLTA